MKGFIISLLTMRGSKQYIENISDITREILKNLRLYPMRDLGEFISKNKRFYSTPCKMGKEMVFFKILIVNETGPIEAIQREIVVRKFLNSYKKEIPTTQLIAFDDKNFPYWYISNYINGKLLGNFYRLHFENLKYIKKIVGILSLIHQIPESELANISRIKNAFFWERGWDGYLKMIKNYPRGIARNILKKIARKSIEKFFIQSKKLFDSTQKMLSHGDFTLANFVVKGEKLFIVDWEQAHIDNFAYDLAHLWIQMWRYPIWKKKMLEEFILHLEKEKIEEFKEIFRAIIITEALGELRFSIKLCEKKYVRGVIAHSIKTIKNALMGFESLIKSE